MRDGICVDPPLCRGTPQGKYGSSIKDLVGAGETVGKVGEVNEMGERELVLVVSVRCGYARAWWPQHLFTLPLRRPDCTLSRLSSSREYDRPVTTLDQVLVSCKSLECVTTPES